MEHVIQFVFIGLTSYNSRDNANIYKAEKKNHDKNGQHKYKGIPAEKSKLFKSLFVPYVNIHLEAIVEKQKEWCN